MYQNLVSLIKELVGHEYLYMDRGIALMMNGQPLTVWAVCVSPAGELYVMDENEQWHLLLDAGAVEKLLPFIQSIYKRYQHVSEC